VQSPTHTLLALALLSKARHSKDADVEVFGEGGTVSITSNRKRNLAIFLGSLIPDIAIYLWAPYQSIVNDVSGAEMWDKLYFEPPMQNLIAWFNSVPIYAGLAVLGFMMRAKTWGKLILFFALAALIHMATDLPVHAEDAYRHFWPVTDWRFYSPLSYWDSNHHAGWVSRFEVVLALGCIAVLWQRFPRRFVKIVLSLLIVFYILVLCAPLIERLLGPLFT